MKRDDCCYFKSDKYTEDNPDWECECGDCKTPDFRSCTKCPKRYFCDADVLRPEYGADEETGIVGLYSDTTENCTRKRIK